MGPRTVAIGLCGLLLALSTGASAQTSPSLAWDENDTSTVTGYAVTIDGTRTDHGLTPAGSGGTCGCSIPLPFSGGAHTIVVSAYNSAGESAAPALIVGPHANPGGAYAGQAGVAVPVSGASSTDTSAGTLTTYTWAWGDGSADTTSSSASASHVYAASGTYVVTLTVVDNAGATDAATTSATISPPPPPALPSPWQLTDVGSTGSNGSASYASGTYTVNGGGADIGGTSDSFAYVYQSLSGDGRVSARVVGVSNTNAAAKAGIMIRETLATDSRQVMLDLEPAGGIEFIARTTAGGNAAVVATTTSAPPAWLQLTRTGGTLVAAISQDGATWSQIGTASISMASTLDVGLIVCSHDVSASNTSTFDNVAVEQGTFAVPPAAPSGPSPADGSTGISSSPTLTWNASGGGAYDVRFGASAPPAQVSTGQTAASFAPGALAQTTTYYWQIVARNSAGDTAGPVWSFTTGGAAAGAVPAPWSSDDVGSASVPGSASYDSGTFTIAGAGADIGGTTDAFHFVDRPLTGDADLAARLVSLQNTNPLAKAGLMMRASLLATAADVTIDATPDGTIEFVARSADGAATTSIATATQSLPAWLKLSKAGSTVTGFVSRDGATWTQVGSTTMSFADGVPAGLAVTSHDASQTATAVFDTVSLAPAAPVVPTTQNVVVYASDASTSSIHGAWRLSSSAGSPDNLMLAAPTRGRIHADAPLATPRDYVDLTFTADAGTPYHIWLRLRARNDNPSSDSVWVQFSDARTNGEPVYAIGSTSGLLVNLATDSSGSSVSGWGWQDGAYWLAQATTVTFATGGAHTVRLQTREDGAEVDQIVLSPSEYLSAPPGPTANDNTIVPR